MPPMGPNGGSSSDRHPCRMCITILAADQLHLPVPTARGKHAVGLVKVDKRLACAATMLEEGGQSKTSGALSPWAATSSRAATVQNLACGHSAYLVLDHAQVDAEPM